MNILNTEWYRKLVKPEVYWCKHYALRKCPVCNSNKHKHYAKGMCYKCYRELIKLKKLIRKLQIQDNPEAFKKKHKVKTLVTWAKNHDRCICCGTTTKKHVSKGLCCICYGRKVYHNANKEITNLKKRLKNKEKKEEGFITEHKKQLRSKKQNLKKNIKLALERMVNNKDV